MNATSQTGMHDKYYNNLNQIEEEIHFLVDWSSLTVFFFSVCDVALVIALIDGGL